MGLLHPLAGGVLRRGLKFQTCTNNLNKFFLTIPGIFGSPHVYHSNMVRIQVTLYWFTFSQEIRAFVLIWIVVDAVFLVAVVSGMSVRLFLDPRKFMASIGKRIFSISTYPSQTGWLQFIFEFTFNILYMHAFTYLALLKYMIINCIVLELLTPVILN